MALYLGKDKIASNGTITGDTLPVGTIVEYDGTEVPVNWELVEDGNISEVIIINGGDYSKETDEEKIAKLTQARESSYKIPFYYKYYTVGAHYSDWYLLKLTHINYLIEENSDDSCTYYFKGLDSSNRIVSLKIIVSYEYNTYEETIEFIDVVPVIITEEDNEYTKIDKMMSAITLGSNENGDGIIELNYPLYYQVQQEDDEGNIQVQRFKCVSTYSVGSLANDLYRFDFHYDGENQEGFVSFEIDYRNLSITEAVALNYKKKNAVIDVEILPEPTAELIDQVYKYNGDLYVCEENREPYNKTSITTGTNLNGGRLAFLKFFNADTANVSLEATDENNNYIKCYIGDPVDDRMGHYGLWLETSFDGVTSSECVGEYGDRGTNWFKLFFDIPNLDLIVTTATGLDGFIEVYNTSKGAIMTKINQDKIFNFKYYDFTIDSGSSATMSNTKEYVATIVDTQMSVERREESLYYGDNAFTINSDGTLTCLKGGLYEISGYAYGTNNTGDYKGTVSHLAVYPKVNDATSGGSYYKNYNSDVLRDRYFDLCGTTVFAMSEGDIFKISAEGYNLGEITPGNTTTNIFRLYLKGRVLIKQIA